MKRLVIRTISKDIARHMLPKKSNPLRHNACWVCYVRIMLNSKGTWMHHFYLTASLSLMPFSGVFYLTESSFRLYRFEAFLVHTR